MNSPPLPHPPLHRLDGEAQHLVGGGGEAVLFRQGEEAPRQGLDLGLPARAQILPHGVAVPGGGAGRLSREGEDVDRGPLGLGHRLNLPGQDLEEGAGLLHLEQLPVPQPQHRAQRVDDQVGRGLAPFLLPSARAHLGPDPPLAEDSGEGRRRPGLPPERGGEDEGGRPRHPDPAGRDALGAGVDEAADRPLPRVAGGKVRREAKAVREEAGEGGGFQEGGERPGGFGRLIRLDGEEEHVGGAAPGPARHPRPGGEGLLPRHLDALFRGGGEVGLCRGRGRAPPGQDDFIAPEVLGERGREQGAHRPRPHHHDPSPRRGGHGRGSVARGAPDEERADEDEHGGEEGLHLLPVHPVVDEGGDLAARAHGGDGHEEDVPVHVQLPARQDPGVDQGGGQDGEEDDEDARPHRDAHGQPAPDDEGGGGELADPDPGKAHQNAPQRRPGVAEGAVPVAVPVFSSHQIHPGGRPVPRRPGVMGLDAALEDGVEHGAGEDDHQPADQPHDNPRGHAVGEEAEKNRHRRRDGQHPPGDGGVHQVPAQVAEQGAAEAEDLDREREEDRLDRDDPHPGEEGEGEEEDGGEKDRPLNARARRHQAHAEGDREHPPELENVSKHCRLHFP